MRLPGSTRDAGWDDVFEDLLFTAAALATQADDPALAPLLQRVEAALAEQRAVDADRQRLRAQAIAARARVAVADAALDHQLARFAKALVRESEPGSEGYVRFFPEPHEDVIALGLDAELPVATLIAELLADEESCSEALRAHAPGVQQAVRLGNVALSDRAEAYAALGRLEARIEAWRETAAATKASVRRRLGALAEEQGLDGRWVASFMAPD